MYIKAIIKDKQGKTFTVEAKNGCRIVIPRGVFEQAKYAYATNLILAQFYQKIKPYANENHAIVEIQTDNALLAQRLSNEGYRVNYLPCAEGDSVET